MTTRLTLTLLGALQFTLDGEPITAFESDKVRALLVYLALEADRPHRREVLAELGEAQLSAGIPRKPERSVRNLIIHALHDEACHAGEIWLLRKMQEADSPSQT